MLNGIIAHKLQALDRTLLELRSLGQVSVKQLRANWQTRRARDEVLAYVQDH